MITRLRLLVGIAWLANVTALLFAVFKHSLSLRDLILISGGLFLWLKGLSRFTPP